MDITKYTPNNDLGTVDDVFMDTKAITVLSEPNPQLQTTLNTNVTQGDILDYVTDTIIKTPTPPIDLGELGRVLVIAKVDTVTNDKIQVITDPLTLLDNLGLAFQYGLI